MRRSDFQSSCCVAGSRPLINLNAKFRTVSALVVLNYSYCCPNHGVRIELTKASLIGGGYQCQPQDVSLNP